METIDPAVLNDHWQAGQTAYIDFDVPISVPLTGKIIRYQVRDNQGESILEKLSPAKITVTDQNVLIAFPPADFRGKEGAYLHGCDACSVDATYEQPLFTGVLTINKEVSKP